MTAAEAAAVLARAALYDRRTVGEIEAHAWAKVLGEIDLTDALEAVDHHYAGTRDWLMPADIAKGVKTIRQRRLSDTFELAPDADPDDEPAYRRALREGRYRAAGAPNPVRAAAVAAIEVGRRIPAPDYRGHR